MVYEVDIVIPTEFSEPSLRIITIIKESNEDAQRVELDLMKEKSQKIEIKEEAIKQQMARKYNNKVHLQVLAEGDLVLRKVELVRKPQGKGKLAPN